MQLTTSNADINALLCISAIFTILTKFLAFPQIIDTLMIIN